VKPSVETQLTDAPQTARPGVLARLMGFFKQLRQPVLERRAPLPEPPVVPAHLLSENVQLEGEGFGKLLGRHYALRLRSTLEPSALMDRVKQNLSALSPDELAAFEKTNGSAWGLKLGDEFHIQILGPWNGAVRVIEVAPDAFSFVTLRGHPEAGKIRFAVTKANAGELKATITSWARSKDAVVDLGYDKLGLGKGLQTTTWRTFLERIAALSDGEMIGEVVVSEQLLEESK
jgi:hypothetical protein